MTVAYFSMEIYLKSGIPTYAGGLGILAGDALRSASDLGLPMVGVTLVHRRGYFQQRLDEFGIQAEEPDDWTPEEHTTALEPRVVVPLEGRDVWLRAWRWEIEGVSGRRVPVILLDSDLPENAPEDRELTNSLYGGDEPYRLGQEALLGIGGVAMLEALGYRDITAYHMNEGHSALLALALLERRFGSATSGLAPTSEDREAVRQLCVFTTHTPVPAGTDQFSVNLVARMLGAERSRLLEQSGCYSQGVLNMTYLALAFSRYINGVAMRHEQISRGMFPLYPINSISNGVHAVHWTSPAFADLFDRHISGWRHDNLDLRYAVGIPLHEVQRAHENAKHRLTVEVEQRTGVAFRPDTMTLGFARRAAVYKRAELIFTDLDRLRRISSQVGPLQIVYAGKAHPKDEAGKALIREVFAMSHALRDVLPIVYIADYDADTARTICAGADLWLNTPLRPLEASGTSGMKAALNGVPSLSVLDGWWIEGHLEGTTGWSVGDSWEPTANPNEDADSLYDKLEGTIVPMFYARPSAYAGVMRSAISINGSFFNTQRMMYQYARDSYSIGIPGPHRSA